MIDDVTLTLLVLIVLAIPLSISGWAFLDVAKRPRWVWAFSGRRQVIWMCAIAFGVLILVGGLLISGYYLTKVRPQLAAIENGEFG